MAVQGTPCQGRGCTCCSSDGSRPSHVLPLLEDTAWHLPRALRPPGMQGRGARVIAWLGHLAQSSEHASCPDGPSRAWLTATWVLHQSTTKSDGRYQIPRPRNPGRASNILSSRLRSSGAVGVTFVFSVCRLVSRRCHSISPIHQLYLSPSQNRTNGFPLSGSSFNHSAWQKGSGGRECVPGASPHAAELGGGRSRYTTGVGCVDSAICTARGASDAYTADSSRRCP